MAKTYAYALAGGLLATFTVSPALSALLLPEKVSETETILVRFLRRVYRRLIDLTFASALADARRRRGFSLVAGFAASTVGLEFLPKLEEGNIWMRATMPASVSLEEGNGYVNQMRAHEELPRSRDGHLPARPSRRRHRSRRLLQRRVLRPAEAARPMAPGPRQGPA